MSFFDGHYRYVGDDPAGVESAMTELGGVAGALARLAGEVEQDTASIQEYWPKGHTGQVAAADAVRIGGALDECHQVFARAGRDLGDLHEVLVLARRKVDELNDAHRVLSAAQLAFQGPFGATLGGRGGPEYLLAEGVLMVARARSGFESVADIDTAYARVKGHVVEETGLCNQLLSRLTAQGCPPVGRAGYGGGVSKYDVSFGLLTAWSGRQVADILAGYTSFPSDPKQVHDAWLALRPDQRAALLAGDPGRFGNLNGIPAADRNTANRQTLASQLDKLRKAAAALRAQPPNSPEDLERLPIETLAELEAMTGISLTEAKQALLLDAQLSRNTNGKTHLLAYEPGAYGGKGRAALAFGDVDQAENIAFSVPGLNSGLHNFNQVTGDALHLYGQAFLADPHRHTAVIAWQGYDAPGLGKVAFQGNAEQGAKFLAADVNAMRATHDGPIGKLTVVGHSYGSTTTGLALQREHLNVDQVALIGSPGVGGEARTVADLHLAKSQVFVGSASRDIVTTAPDSLGEDPSEDTFGATRFKAESVERSWYQNFPDHSLYYDSGRQSESLYALADIVTGHGDRLGQDGMIAEPRHTEKLINFPGLSLDQSDDPEGSRPPTAGHDHANDAGRPSP